MGWKPAIKIYHDRFAAIITDDGSPTIRDLSTANQECMHHAGGAYQETQYIYGEAIRTVINTWEKTTFLVVGLGLGYIEILIACEGLKAQKLSDCSVISFESEEYLRMQFQHWLTGKPSELDEIYQQRDSLFHQDYPQEMPQVRAWLGKNLCLEREVILLPQQRGKMAGILFDAYSAKTAPDLWHEDFLIAFLEHYSAPGCLFVTYASTGTLKRALKACDFTLQERAGFQGKKESTWAVKNG